MSWLSGSPEFLFGLRIARAIACACLALAVLLVGPPLTVAHALCGDGVVDAGEDCDLGGTCIGGSAAGAACHVGDTPCTGGTCTTFGGKGCAANCTAEHDVSVPMTFKAFVASDFLSIPLGNICNGGVNVDLSCTSDADCPEGTCVGMQQVWTVGKEKDGKIPVVVKAASIQSAPIPISGLACGCIRGVAYKTCGGTFFDPDGVTLSPNCTPGYTSGDPCTEEAPCAFVCGEGNTACGEIGCDACGPGSGDVLCEQDSGGASGACAPPNMCPASVHIVDTLCDPPGSALLLQALGITTALGACTGTDLATYGPDGMFCTADDPLGGLISAASIFPSVTGAATAVVHNANGSNGVDLGPVTAHGAPFSCAALECGDQSSAAGGVLAACATLVHLDTVDDVAEAIQMSAAGTPPAACPASTPTPRVCAGDCDGDETVTVDEIITIVNLALEIPNAAPCPAEALCSGGVPDIGCITQVTGNALYGCP